MTTNHTEIIKDKLSILDVVGSYVTLEKAGKTWKGKSPFTNEKTPSFFVSPEKGFFYCFSSGKGGDIFTFIQEIERVDFREALTILADRAGVDLGNQDLGKDKPLYKLLDDATKWYEVSLRKNTEAVNYLLNRGLTKETIVQFRIGFAHDAWSDLYDYLSKKKKYTDADINKAGLITSKDGKRYYDRFRSRIMFPIMDSQGRVIGFSGRIFSSKEDDKSAKYVNSPEGPLFDKSHVLYGYHTAKSAISQKKTCILVEGQFDVLMAQQAGSTNTVAVSGTGLTDGHISMIKRFTDTVTLCFDSDKAGINATRRSVMKAYEHGMKVKIIMLPFGKDPADIIHKSVSEWEVYLKDTKDYLDYRLELFDHQFPHATFEEKHRMVTSDLFEIISLIDSKVTQEHMMKKVALFLGVTEASVQQDFENYEPEHTVVPKEDIPLVQSPQKEAPREDILGTYLVLKTTDEDTEDITTLYQECYGEDIQTSIENLQAPLRALLEFKHEVDLETSSPQKLKEHLILTLKQELIRSLKDQSQTVLTEIRTLERKGDEAKITELQHKNMSLRKRIDELTHD